METSARERECETNATKKKCKKKSTVIILPKQYYNQQKTALIVNFMNFMIMFMIMIITITYISIRLYTTARIVGIVKLQRSPRTRCCYYY